MLTNSPALWQAHLPRPQRDGHKYKRGHVVVLGGVHMTGAARLASEAAMRTGAGVCTIVTDAAAAPIYQSGAPHVLVETYESLSRFADHLADARRTAVLLGPGAGLALCEDIREAVLSTLAYKRATILDADALTVFAEAPATLFASLHSQCILTPHEGEFVRIFPSLTGDRPARALQAAQASGAVVLLKGAETVIAHPDGRVVINKHATPYLATAGSGDVLAGICAGLLAQGMDAFSAACAAVWMHGEAGLHVGAGLVAPDLIVVLPVVLKGLMADE